MLNLNRGSVHGSAKSPKVRTEPNFGNTSGRGTYEGAFLRWGRRHAEIAEDADEALKATVSFAYPWRGGSELGEVGEGIEEWQRRCAVEG